MNRIARIPSIALIGLGNQGRKHLNSILVLEKRNLVRLGAICDISRNKDISVLQAPFYTNYKKLLDKTKPDIVLISTPNYLHKQIVMEALDRNIHVIKEKPLAMDYKEAEELFKKARQKDKKIITLQQRFYSPSFIMAKNIIPRLGKIINFSYRFTLDDKIKSWRWDLEKAGGGSWLSMGWHAVSTVQWLIGDITTIVLDWKVNHKRPWSYKTDHSSLAKVIVGKNILGSLFLSCVYPKKEEVLKVTFSTKSLYLSRGSLKVYDLKSKEVLETYENFMNEDEIYIEQMKTVLNKITGEFYDGAEDLDTMKVIQAGLRSLKLRSSPIELSKESKTNPKYAINTYANL